MKKVLFIVVMLVILICTSLACGISVEDYTTVKTELDTALKDKKAAEAEIDFLTAQISSLEDEMDTLRKKYEPPVTTSGQDTSSKISGIFSKYGFSFSYPTDYSISEMGMFGDVPNNDSGVVQAKLTIGQNMFQVIWVNINPKLSAYVPTNEDLLDSAFVIITKIGLEDIRKGDVLKTNIAENTMFYQRYSSMLLNQRVSGVVGVFFSEVESRFYQFFTLQLGNHTNKDNYDYFNIFTISFTEYNA